MGKTWCNNLQLTLPETNSSHLKHWCWKMSFPLGFGPPGRCELFVLGCVNFEMEYNVWGWRHISKNRWSMWSDTSYRCKTFPWKSKTIKIIVPNLGWWKFPTKTIDFGENLSFNGLWTSRDSKRSTRPIFLGGPLSPGEEALETLHKRLLFRGVSGFSGMLPMGSMGLVYLLRFTIKTSQMWANIPYMDGMGYGYCTNILHLVSAVPR